MKGTIEVRTDAGVSHIAIERIIRIRTCKVGDEWDVRVMIDAGGSSWEEVYAICKGENAERDAAHEAGMLAARACE